MNRCQSVLTVLTYRWMPIDELRRHLGNPRELDSQLERLRRGGRIWRMVEYTSRFQSITKYCLPHRIPDSLIGRRIVPVPCRNCQMMMEAAQ